MCSGGCEPYRKFLKASADAGVHPKARRCAPTSRACLFVFVQSGRATEVAVDFVSGRGWNTSGQLLDEQERQELAAEIEWAYIRAPLEDIVMLETKPQELCSWQISLLDHGSLLSTCCLLGCKGRM